MKKIICGVILAGSLFSIASCKKYLDEAFMNPNKPVDVDPELVLPAIISNFARGHFFDARGLGSYIQYWARTASGDNWDRMGYTPGSDFGAEKWRTHYWNLGHNVMGIIADGRATNRPAYAGAGYALFALSWLELADYHGDVILKEALRTDQYTFTYDKQEEVYEHVKVLCDSAMFYFQEAKLLTPNASFANADRYFYQGNLDRWIRFVNGIRAKVYNRYILKGNYKADSVIYWVDQSMQATADDAIIRFDPALVPTEARNFYGPTRNNLGGYRQTQYLVNQMNGTSFGSVVDPRLRYIFKPAQDGGYRGLNPNAGETGLAVTQRPPNFWGFYTTAAPAGGVDTGARTYFKNFSPLPIMTYSELQFIKAEAQIKKGDQANANTAYMNGINGSFDHLLTHVTGYQPITPADRAAFLADTGISTNVNLSKIMVQKFIALWPWGMEEIWVDLRKYQYNPAIFRGFTPPTSLYPDNAGKLAQRARPRYNSEYIWNVEALKAIGALELDYHTKPVWFSQP